MQSNSYLFGDQEGRQLLGKVNEYLKNKKIYLNNSSNLIFVCGSARSEHARMRFIEQLDSDEASKHLKPILAEEGYEALKNIMPNRFCNSSEFEIALGKVCSCIVIFLESAGAIAELGLFSAHEEFAKKTYVIKDYTHQGRSFINTGPIDSIQRYSTFPNAYVLSGISQHAYNCEKIECPIVNRPAFRAEDLLPIIREIHEVIPPPKKRSQRKPFNFKGYSLLDERIRFFITLEIVNLFSVLRLDDLKIVFELLFGEEKIDSNLYKLNLALLEGVKYVSSDLSLDRTDKYFVSNAPNQVSFLETEAGKPLIVDSEYVDLQMKIYKYYQKHRPEIVNYLSQGDAA